MNRPPRAKATPFALAQVRQGLATLPPPPGEPYGSHRAFVNEPGLSSAKPDGPTVPFRHITFEQLDDGSAGWTFTGKVLLALDEVGQAALEPTVAIDRTTAKQALEDRLHWPHGRVDVAIVEADRLGTNVLVELRLKLWPT